MGLIYGLGIILQDDTDRFGVEFVKVNDKRTAKNYGVDSFPSLIYFRLV